MANAWVLLEETLVFDCISVESLAMERRGVFSEANVTVPDVVFLSSHILHPRLKFRQLLCIRRMMVQDLALALFSRMQTEDMF